MNVVQATEFEASLSPGQRERWLPFYQFRLKPPSHQPPCRHLLIYWPSHGLVPAYWHPLHQREPLLLWVLPQDHLAESQTSSKSFLILFHWDTPQVSVRVSPRLTQFVQLPGSSWEAGGGHWQKLLWALFFLICEPEVITSFCGVVMEMRCENHEAQSLHLVDAQLVLS